MSCIGIHASTMLNAMFQFPCMAYSYRYDHANLTCSNTVAYCTCPVLVLAVIEDVELFIVKLGIAFPIQSGVQSHGISHEVGSTLAGKALALSNII